MTAHLIPAADLAKIREALEPAWREPLDYEKEALAILDNLQEVEVVGYVDGRGRFFYKEDPHINLDHAGMPNLYALKGAAK